ncbi:MAG: spherulation-specific family 4 protein, partial [Propionibacteriaceae bacterium]|nr:spherulation-specific family 4 protein [Propionibacteriaceae bacterium]
MRTAVPFYLHPAEHPTAWQALLSGRLDVAFAVVNVFDGPGQDVDPYYAPVLAEPREVPLVGYVDVAYGARPTAEVLLDAERWSHWYGIDAVMLDRVPTVPQVDHWTFGTMDALRESGARLVVANPGTVPDLGLLEVADVTCVMEVGWDLVGDGMPLPTVDAPPAKVWHLVHGVPPEHVEGV